ncbi:MAG: 4-amino-4-deoxy-L-arabinose transferase, partial [Flavobacteriaceae bacterium]|nr:4-amino-4-deoxy-L-arabinose transferase [Flavobacteriaceae bacterium]
MKGNKQKLFWGIMVFIGLANTLQAVFTELIYDEAYYWYFSKQLDWGYFDHPPMVAAMIALGQLFFKGTLGVRII